MIPETPTQLRAAIDRGETGDKISHSDPAAAPLGTDEEAGGAPAFRQSFAREIAQGGAVRAAKNRPKPPFFLMLSVAMLLVTAIFIWGSLPQ